MNKMQTPVPVWVSRRNADGVIAQFTVSMWLFMLIGIVMLCNVLLWGGIGLYEAITYIV